MAEDQAEPQRFKFYVSLTWDDWPEGGSFAEAVWATDGAQAERTFHAYELRRRGGYLCVQCWLKHPTRNAYTREPNCMVVVRFRAAARARAGIPSGADTINDFPFSLLCATCGAGLGDVYKNSVRRFERLLKGGANG